MAQTTIEACTPWNFAKRQHPPPNRERRLSECSNKTVLPPQPFPAPAPTWFRCAAVLSLSLYYFFPPSFYFLFLFIRLSKKRFDSRLFAREGEGKAIPKNDSRPDYNIRQRAPIGRALSTHRSLSRTKIETVPSSSISSTCSTPMLTDDHLLCAKVCRRSEHCADYRGHLALYQLWGTRHWEPANLARNAANWCSSTT